MGKIIKNGISYGSAGSSGGSDIQVLTQEEYDALVTAGTVDENIYYFIGDEDENGEAGDNIPAFYIGYDNTESGLEATDVQGAVDEVNGRVDEISNDVTELNQNMGNCTFSVQSDGAYVTYTPTGGADSVTKKLGSEPITIPKIYLYNTTNITTGGGKDVHMGAAGTTTSEFKISCKDHGTLKIEKLTSSVSIVCQKANGSTVTKTYSVAGSALDISDYDYITLEPTCTTRITHAYSQSLSGSSSITLTNVVLS